MKPRQVVKYNTTKDEIEPLNEKLKQYIDIDRHAIDGKYIVRSLYFDDSNDTGLKDRRNNAENRELFRIRYYNNDPSFIRLEKKIKRNKLGKKINYELTPEQVTSIINNDVDWMKEIEDELIQDFYQKITEADLKPKVIVEYTRYPFIYDEGDLRLTLDFDVFASRDLENFLIEEIERTPLNEDQAIIEVKWSGDLPKIIEDTVGMNERTPSLISKYVANRDKIDN